MYSNAALANSDLISVVMTSNYPCPVSPTAISNVITMTVNPLPVGTNANTVSCSGVAVNYNLQTNVNTLPGNSVNSNFTWFALSNNPQVTGESLAPVAGDLITDVLVNLTNTTQSVLYRVTPTSDPEGCVGSFFDIFVTINPTPNAAASGNAPQCSGSTTNITVSNPNNVAGTTYNWSAPATPGISELGAPVGANGVLLSTHIMQMLTNTTNAPIVVTFTITPVGPAPGFCAGTPIMVNVTVNPTPAGTIAATPTAVCAGAPVMLTFTATAGMGNFNVTVNGTPYPGVVSGVPFVTVNPLVNTTYTLNSITDANGCTNASPGSSASVTINPNANAGTVSGTTPLCIGATTTYASSGDAGGTWSSTNMTVATVGPGTGIVTTLSAGTTNITYTVNSGCFSPVSAFKTLTVSPNVNAGTISGTSPLCSGATATYMSSGTPGGTWSSTNMAVATVNPVSGLVSALAPGTTDITYTISSGCGSPVSAFKTLTVSANATAGTVSGTSPLCNGGMTTFTSTGDIGGTWSSTNMAVATVVPATGVVTAVGPGSTNITYTVNSGCGSPVSAFQALTVNARPTAVLTGTTSICNGQSTLLTLTVTGSMPISGMINGSIAFSGTAPTITVSVSPTMTTMYSITSLTDANCTAMPSDWSGTVTITVTNCSDISGKIIWEADHLAPIPSGVAITTVTLSGDASDTDITGIPGTYVLNALSGTNFVVTPKKNRPMPDAINGLTAADASRIQQHVTGLFPLTDPYKLIAADVNKTNSITAQDVSLITQAILGSPIAQAIFINTTWRFVPKAYVFPMPTIPWGFPETITLTGAAVNQDFIGAKLGDVNNSANPATNPNALPPDLIWTVQDQLLEQDATYTVEFRAGNFDELLALQFGLSFNPATIQFLDIETIPGSPIQAGNFGLFNVATGEIRAMLAMTQSTSLPNGTPAFRIRFKALQGGQKLSEVLNLNNSVLLGEAYLSDFTPGPVNLVYEGIVTGTVDPTAAATLRLLQNRPNPFKDNTSIGFILPDDCEAQIRVFDVSGRLVTEQKAWYPKGYNEMQFRLGDYAGDGMLYYELVTPFGILSKKMVLVRE